MQNILESCYFTGTDEAFPATGCVSLIGFHMWLYIWCLLAGRVMQQISKSPVIGSFPCSNAAFLGTPCFWAMAASFYMLFIRGFIPGVLQLVSESSVISATFLVQMRRFWVLHRLCTSF